LKEMNRSHVESLPINLSENEYMSELCKWIKKWKLERNEKKKQALHDTIQRRKAKMQTFICSKVQLVKKALTLKENANQYLLKKLGKKRKFRKLAWVTVPSCATTSYQCASDDFCLSQTIHDKYNCGGYYNILAADFICKNCWKDMSMMSNYYEDVSDTEIDLLKLFPQIKQVAV